MDSKSNTSSSSRKSDSTFSPAVSPDDHGNFSTPVPIPGAESSRRLSSFGTPLQVGGYNPRSQFLSNPTGTAALSADQLSHDDGSHNGGTSVESETGFPMDDTGDVELQKKDGNTSNEKSTKAEMQSINEAQQQGVKGEGSKTHAASLVNTANASLRPKVVRLPRIDWKKYALRQRMQIDDADIVEKAEERTEARNGVEFFRHLPQYEHGSLLTDLESKFFQTDTVHPDVYNVGLRYVAGDISGGNARCIAMLEAFKMSIEEYSTPVNTTLKEDLTRKINSYVTFLVECRPLSISMANAIRFLIIQITKLPSDLSESESKSSLISCIDSFMIENILQADEVIVEHAVTKIRDGDVLLTYTSSSAVEMLLLHAHKLGRKFRVVIVDSRPKLKGQMLLRRLVGKGISCTYTHINAIFYVMHEVTRVFLGASSVLANGVAYSRVGTASVAMVAHQFRVPVVLCCKAYKFHERIQLDSICFNKLGDPDDISKVSGRKEISYLEGWASIENLQLVNLIYDITPSDYISMIITDYGTIPPSSAPLIVNAARDMHS